MTQTGKCDTCRQRKVKCDEEKPKCGACRKKDRPCIYSYGRASAFVVQDPNLLTKHGTSTATPLIYPLEASEDSAVSSPSIQSDLQITTEREAENGQGTFQTLALTSRKKMGTSRKALAHQRRKLELYLQQLQAESALSVLQPMSSETALISRYINMLGPWTASKQPLSVLGTWIHSIPSRIGHNRMMDLAVDFLIKSYEVYWDNTYTKRGMARTSKERALKELQLFVNNGQNRPTYEVVLVTKMHYAAEALLGIDTMYHAIHAFGLAQLLKSGTSSVFNVDDEHFWNLIDNTYIDDVNEALLGGRNSVYDNEFYLSTTYPPPLTSSHIVLTPFQRASMAIMHIFIQCPRLNNMVRKAITNPGNTIALVEAITLAESLWQLDLTDQVSPLLQESITVNPTAPSDDLADIVPNSLAFTSVQSMILCTRYWMLINVLGGLVDTLYRHFPSETTLSLLPDRYTMHKLETDAAMNLAKSIPWADSISHSLPLVPLRLHTPLQLSIGPWYRTIRRLEAVRAASPGLYPAVLSEIARTISVAKRMKDNLIAYCNGVHSQWDVSTVSERPLIEALNTMTGEPIPEWMPVRVRFEAEDGEMVMKLDYEHKEGRFEERFDIGDHPPKRYRDEVVDKIEGRPRTAGDFVEEVLSGVSWKPRAAADFVHGTGRGLCSTSGWWPRDGEADETRTPAETKRKFRVPELGRPDDGTPLRYVDRQPVAAGLWTQTWSVETGPGNVCLSPAWASHQSLVFNTTLNQREVKGEAWVNSEWRRNDQLGEEY